MLHDACISEVIKIVKACQATCLMEMNMEITQLQNSNLTLTAQRETLLKNSTIHVHVSPVVT